MNILSSLIRRNLTLFCYMCLAILLFWSCSVIPELDYVDKNKSTKHFYYPGNKIVYSFSFASPEVDFDYFDTGLREIEGADAESFRVINKFYSADKDSFYYKDRNLNVDFRSFKILNGRYSADRYSAYYQDIRLDEESIETLQALDGGNYAVGKEGIYYDGELFFVEDIDSFTSVEFESGRHFGIDDKAVYCGKKVFSNDPNSFKYLGMRGHYSDGRHIYRYCERLEFDVSSFQVLNGDGKTESIYAKDGDNVYVLNFDDLEVIHADVETFRAFCGKGLHNYAVDKDHVYERGKIVEGMKPEKFSFDQSCR